MNKSKFKKKYLLGLASSPLTLFPLAAGVTGLLLLGALDIGTPAAWLACAAGIVFGLGVFFQRLVLGCPKIARQAQEEVECEGIQEREESLDELDKQLVGDRDPRTQTLLRRLRELADLIQEDSSWKSSFDNSTVAKLFSAINHKFSECTEDLQRTLELKELANMARTDEVREMHLAERDRIIEIVTEIVDEFHEVVKDLRNPEATTTDGGARHSRENLQQILDVGRRVQERLGSAGLKDSE